MNDLALKIGEIDRVIIDNGEGANTSGCQIDKGWRTKAARAYYQNMRTFQTLLTWPTYFPKDNMACIALKFEI
jgi:hypothetical protein